ncbi:unnamed protein product [Gongylonema pulchrum]|uniref:G_PROTEIN_RECEP_F1_2 domain-containing protein n=1 Tax=Gongylonema pulchrum TaxID=637853 RepID=A0A183CXU1_9BILA|nr:unnamed protein product [Gongylonema pulchrum]
MQAASLLMLSIDRVFALCTPMLYFRQQYTIGITEIAACVAVVAIYTFTSCWFSLLDTKPVISPLCWLHRAAVATFERRQLKLTSTVCVSCLFTTVLFVVPMCARYFKNSILRKYKEIISVYSPISCNLNPVAVIITICVIQDDIRHAMLSSLPQRLQLLVKHKSTVKTISSTQSLDKFRDKLGKRVAEMKIKPVTCGLP